MNPIIESLVEIAESDPLPAAYTSSHWQRYERETLVERRGDVLVLRGVGFGSVYARSYATHILNVFERLSYRPVTKVLAHYSSVWNTARRLARDLSFGLTFDVWKCAVALALLAEHWAVNGLQPKSFALIGDGYGFLGALVRRYRPSSRLYCIDLPKMLVFQARTYELADREARMSVLSANNKSGQGNIVFVLPQEVENILDEIDCAINIASMQEMNEFSVASYFTFLRRRSTPRSRFYCVNRSRKELPGGEVSSFNNYPWHKDDDVFIDGPCPYYTHILSPQTLPKGPKLLGVRVPLINYFDDVLKHRLVHLAPLTY